MIARVRPLISRSHRETTPLCEIGEGTTCRGLESPGSCGKRGLPGRRAASLWVHYVVLVNMAGTIPTRMHGSRHHGVDLG